MMLAFLLVVAGGVLLGQGKEEVAGRPYEIALDSANRLYERASTADGFVTAIQAYRFTIDLAKREDSIPWHEIALCHYEIETLLDALELHEEAEKEGLNSLLAIQHQPRLSNRDSTDIVYFLNTLATQSSKLGKMDVARSHIVKALDLSTRLVASDPDLRPHALNNAASIFNNLGLLSAADSCARLSISGRMQIYQKAKRAEAWPAINLAYSLITMAEVLNAEAGDPRFNEKAMGDSAIKYLDQTKVLLPKLDAGLRLEIDKNYAIAYQHQQDYPKAVATFANAVKAANASSGARSRGMLLEAQGKCLQAMRDFDGALRSFQLSLMAFTPGFRDSIPSHNPEKSFWSDEPWLFVLFNDKARAYAAMDRTDMALECRNLAFQYVNHLREHFGTSGSKAFISNMVYGEFEDAIALAYNHSSAGQNMANCEQVFEFMELSKTNEILESMVQASQFDAFGIPEAKLLEWRSLQAKIADAMSRGGQNVQDLIAQQDALKTEIETLHPQLADFTQKFDRVAIADVQGKLHADDVFLEYFVGKKAIYIMAIGHDRHACYRRPIGPHFDDLVKQMVKAISLNPGTDDSPERYQAYEGAAYALYRQLLGPMVDGKFMAKVPRTLLIVPDGKLALFPFEALITYPNTRDDFSSASYLIRDCEVRYAHSVTTLKAQLAKAQKDTVGDKGMLAISASPAGKGLSKLPNAYREAEYAKDVVGGKHLYRSLWRSLTSEVPSKERFRKLASDYSLIHFACHAIIDTLNPMHSWIALDNGADHPDSLFAYEIIGIPLHAQLVVLSACETGKGRLQSGEGVMSLARAFFVAGGQRVIMSLWNLDDRSTSEIMESFYDHLKAGKPAAQSLRMARLDYIDEVSDPHKAHPYYWAAMVMVGNDGLYLPQGPTSWRPWIIWGVIVAFIIALISRRGKRKKAGRR